VHKEVKIVKIFVVWHGTVEELSSFRWPRTLVRVTTNPLLVSRFVFCPFFRVGDWVRLD